MQEDSHPGSTEPTRNGSPAGQTQHRGKLLAVESEGYADEIERGSFRGFQWRLGFLGCTRHEEMAVAGCRARRRVDAAERSVAVAGGEKALRR